MRFLSVTGPSPALAGRVLCHDLSPALRKGTILRAEHIAQVPAGQEVHVAELEAGDVHEDMAARRLGRALSGRWLEAREPVQSQVRVVAGRRGLLRVDANAVAALNRPGPVSVFTVFDGQAVDVDDEVAGAKVTLVAVAASDLEAAEAVCAASPVLELVPFRPLRTFVVVTERLKPRARLMFREAVARKLGWYGADVVDLVEVARERSAVAAAYASAIAAGAQLILFAGASAIDPLDSAYGELRTAGGEVVRVGAPAHPGSMLWLGRLGEANVLGVASCAGFGRSTALDLVLPFVFAYGRIEAADLARLGHGGLVEVAAGRRFPAYS